MLLRIAALALTTLAALPQDLAPLYPAGPIQGALGSGSFAILVEDEPTARKQAEWVQRSFFAGRSEIVVGEACLDADVRGKNLLVYGTLDGHPWLQRHRERLPFHLGEGRVELDGAQPLEGRGEHLRVLCCIKNPDDLERRAVLYVTEHTADLDGINGVFHGPTEYVVADGDRTLDSGSFGGATKLTPEEMLADFELLVEKLMEVHPRTVDGSWEALDEAIEAAYGALETPMHRLELWFTLVPIVGAFEDAHTTLGRPGDGGSFPLPLSWMDEGLVVTRDVGELQTGDRIVEVGGASPEQLMSALGPLIPADNDHWRRHQAARWLADAGLLEALGLAEQGKLEVKLERDQRVVETTLARGQLPRDDEDRDWVRWTFHQDGRLALFTLDRCVVDEHYLDRLERFFREVRQRGAQTIAIDLRENSGGNSGVCDEFLRYLPIESYDSYSAAIRTSLDSNSQRGDAAKIGLKRYGAQVRQNERHDATLRFEGELVVLTSARTFSSGVWFATVLKDNGLAEVVGEPTGGAPSAYGDVLQFTLPASSLNLWISYKQWIRPDPGKDPANTLTPDLVVARTSSGLAEGRDPVLEAVLERAR